VTTDDDAAEAAVNKPKSPQPRHLRRAFLIGAWLVLSCVAITVLVLAGRGQLKLLHKYLVRIETQSERQYVELDAKSAELNRKVDGLAQENRNLKAAVAQTQQSIAELKENDSQNLKAAVAQTQQSFAELKASDSQIMRAIDNLRIPGQAKWPTSTRNYFVNPSSAGTDTNDCLSETTACKTLRHVCSILPDGMSTIRLMDGTYDPDGCTILYDRIVTVIGNCPNRERVVIRGPKGYIFNVEDHAILGLNCVTGGTSTSGDGAILIATRQFAIADAANIDFDNLHTGLAANENSKINCGPGNRIIGDMTYYMQASGNGSAIIAVCPITFINEPSVYALYYAGQEASLYAQGASFAGDRGTIKYKFVVDHATIYLPVPNDLTSVPGSGAIVRNGAMLF
jgi:hypothetical protein